VVGPGESAVVGWTVRVEDHAHLVDGDVMVVPAEGDQIVRIMISALGSWFDVVGLEPVAARTVDLALSLIPVKDIGSDGGGDGFSPVGHPDRSPILSLEDHLDLSGAEDLRKGVGSDPWPRGETDPGLTVGLGG
jgi:hypothetical protein